jgi:CRP-like cAMP-binding protein
VRKVYLIEEGVLKLSHWEHAGRRVVTGLRFRGSVLGGAPTILEAVSVVSAETLTRCRVREMSAETFRAALKANLELSWHIHQLHSRELHDQVEHLAGFGSLRAQDRLARFLLELARSQPTSQQEGNAIRLATPLKRWELAEAIMTSPQHLSRLLNALEQQHVVAREKGWLVLLQPGALACVNHGDASVTSASTSNHP